MVVKGDQGRDTFAECDTAAVGITRFLLFDVLCWLCYISPINKGVCILIFLIYFLLWGLMYQTVKCKVV